jgi:TolB-like protein/DNA-binding winged helix-turn-helix (wHTH) protein/Tfp pilus assembly protein PilF
MTTTIRDADSHVDAAAKRLRFDRYVLDLDRGSLLLDGGEIALRPKTFAVLQYLVANAGRLVSKDELFAAVWLNLAITDDALVQSIGEMRRALGADGARLIKTIPRRGYRFESDVSVVAPIQAFPSATVAPPLSPNGPRADATVPVPASTFPAVTLTGWRAGVFAALALVIVLAAGALLVGLASEWSFLGAPRSGNPATKTADIGAKPAIAVVPLVDQGDDAAREYFADGLTQDVINALGRFSSLTVMSWNAVFPYKGKPASPDDLRRSLAVGYLVEGSVRRSSDRVRVNAQLVDTKDGRVLWSARFDEALTDVFALQDEIAAQIVRALAIRLTQLEQRRALAKPTANLEAYDYVLRARPALLRPTRANNAEARTLLRRAIELDPNYAAAYSALAETFHIATALGWAESPTAFLSRAEELATKALSLDDSEVLARVVLARIHIFYQRYEQAGTEIERAVAVNPNDARALAGRGNILMWLGQADAAIETLELAQRIDPDLNSIDRFALSLAYYLKRRYDAAIEQSERTVRPDAGPRSAHVVLAAAYAQHDRAEDAARVVRMIRRLNPTFDPHEFGTKFLRAADLEHLRDGLRKAGIYAESGVPPSGN